MQFLIYDRRSIERGIVVRTPYVLISIRDPDKPAVRPRKPAALRDALFLAFHDAEPARSFPLPPEIRLMESHDAVKIWEFVQTYREKVGTIVCHCEQGMSRSPAAAIALAEALGGDVEVIRADSQPNEYVYRLMRDTIAQLSRGS
ncbi:MAG: hypothetical protein FJ297_05920 [Planctomycetes bacterium]|nr:hypothetical protein [Planctomycetota bacterium]